MPHVEPAGLSIRRFAAIGTTWEIETERAIDDATMSRIQLRIDEYDRTYSRFRPDSAIADLAGRGGSHTFSDDVIALFDLYDVLADVTDGAVNPLVGARLSALGYNPEYTLQPSPDLAVSEPAPNWARTVHRDSCTVTLAHPALIDIGAAGKGHLADIVAAILADAGHPDAVVDASGDIVVGARITPVRIALEHPCRPASAIGVAELTGGAICGSASNRRRWGAGLHHVLDARDGNPADDIIATWAVASTGLVADGLATALFFVPPLRLEAAFEFTWMRVFASGVVEYSSGFEGEVFA